MIESVRDEVKKIFRTREGIQFFFKKNEDYLKGSYSYPSAFSSIRENLLGGHQNEKIDAIFLEENDLEFLGSQQRFKDLIGNGNFNPYEPYQLAEYFVRTDTLDKFSVIHTFKNNPEHLKNIIHIGGKGSGKTALQNFWLSENNRKLEDDNIFWVRCDGHKLYQLWLDHGDYIKKKDNEKEVMLNPDGVNKLVDIREYLDIQFIYVFSKYCLNEDRDFLKKIISSLEEDNHSVEYPISRRNKSTKTRLLLECIHELRETINREEKNEDRSYSYAYSCVMKISLDSYQLEKRRWISISRALQNYFKKKDIWILDIVDGVDNVHINEKSAKPYYVHMINEAHKFIKRRPSDKRIHFMALRERTYIDIMINHPIMLDTAEYLDEYKINHSPACFRDIIEKRYNFSKNKYFDSGSLYDKVAKSVINSAVTTVEGQTHNNAREFLHNKVTLISQVYYRIKQLNMSSYNIDSHVRILRTRNRYLNGRLFLNTKSQWGDINTEPGVCSMNIFYFDLDKYPCKSPEEWFGLCKTRILQMLKEDGQTIPEEKIINYLNSSLGYPKLLVAEDISHLRAFGMIDSKYYEEEISYAITPKGKRYIEHVYADIDTLYYFSLDTPLPSQLMKDKIIKGHDNRLHVRTYYPSSAISTVLSFLGFLLFLNNVERERKERKGKQKHDYLGNLDCPISNKNIHDKFMETVDRLLRSMDSVDNGIVRETLDSSLYKI